MEIALVEGRPILIWEAVALTLSGSIDAGAGAGAGAVVVDDSTAASRSSDFRFNPLSTRRGQDMSSLP